MQNQFITLLEKRKSLCEKLGISLENLNKHANFLNFLWEKNQNDLNIVSRKMTKEELVSFHWLDSLLALPIWPNQFKKVADLGSGGGFPAIPLAIERPNQDFYLYEKSPKKQTYLKALVAYLELKNVYIKASIPEDIDVDLITARAFKSLDGILQVTKTHYKNKKPYFLFKGTPERIKEELVETKQKRKHLNYHLHPLETYGLGVERNILSLYI